MHCYLTLFGWYALLLHNMHHLGGLPVAAILLVLTSPWFSQMRGEALDNLSIFLNFCSHVLPSGALTDPMLQ